MTESPITQIRLKPAHPDAVFQVARSGSEEFVDMAPYMHYLAEGYTEPGVWTITVFRWSSVTLGHLEDLLNTQVSEVAAKARPLLQNAHEVYRQLVDGVRSLGDLLIPVNDFLALILRLVKPVAPIVEAVLNIFGK